HFADRKLFRGLPGTRRAGTRRLWLLAGREGSAPDADSLLRLFSDVARPAPDGLPADTRLARRPSALARPNLRSLFRHPLADANPVLLLSRVVGPVRSRVYRRRAELAVVGSVVSRCLRIDDPLRRIPPDGSLRRELHDHSRPVGAFRRLSVPGRGNRS